MARQSSTQLVGQLFWPRADFNPRFDNIHDRCEQHPGGMVLFALREMIPPHCAEVTVLDWIHVGYLGFDALHAFLNQQCFASR